MTFPNIYPLPATIRYINGEYRREEKNQQKSSHVPLFSDE
jgi:hypothetical protein